MLMKEKEKKKKRYGASESLVAWDINEREGFIFYFLFLSFFEKVDV